MNAQEIYTYLKENVGPTLTAFMANSRSLDVELNEETNKRLRLAWFVFDILSIEEDADIARQWLIGANPRLGDEPPALCIREYERDKVLAAMFAFMEDSIYV